MRKIAIKQAIQVMNTGSKPIPSSKGCIVGKFMDENKISGSRQSSLSTIFHRQNP